MRLAGIQEESIVDGPGLRTTIFTQGCKHHCFNCHNPQTWDFNGGKEYTVPEIIERLKQIPIIHKVTISGGDPFYQDLSELTYLIQQLYRNDYHDTIVYTGFTFEEVLNLFKCQIISHEQDIIRTLGIEYYFLLARWENVTIVTDPYMETLKSYETKYRGSSNQRVFKLLRYYWPVFVWEELTHKEPWV